MLWQKEKIRNQIYKNLFIFAATPSLSGQGGLLQTPSPQLFSQQKFLNFFHRNMGIWTKGM